MKKLIAVMLCFACVFAFAACTKKDPDNAPETEPTGTPGEWVTDAEGKVVITQVPFLDLDENGEPQTDANGNALTTIVNQIETYPAAPGETIPPKSTVPTVAPGNTLKSEGSAWPAHSYMSKLPKLRDKIDKTTYNKDKNGQLTTVYVNEISYADFLAYIETCKKAGFTQSNTGTVLPEKAAPGKSYIFASQSHGLYITFTYYTDEYPYRNCDLFISVADYDLLEAEF